MTTHGIRHKLNKINKYAVECLLGCGYVKDYDTAIKNIITAICQLGDDLDKPDEEVNLPTVQKLEMNSW